MLYLNLPLQYYVTLLIVICVVIAVLGFYYVRKVNDGYIKLILIWTIILFELNFVNMIFTLKNYMKNSVKRGTKGPKGNRGPRGLNGFSVPCNINACRKQINSQRKQKGEPEIEDIDHFGVNVNDNQKTKDNDRLKIGKCIFPFIHNHVFHWECLKTVPGSSSTQPFNDDIINADKDGWCATELNGDLTVKKYGYCNKQISENFKLKQEQNNQREERLDEYIEENYGITEMKIISGVNSDIKCPKGYTKIPKDLNSGTDGNFVYICKKIETASLGVNKIKIVEGLESCPNDLPLKLRGNLNDGVFNSTNLTICASKSNKDFITDILIKDTSEDIEGYTRASDNINQGVSEEPIYIFYSNSIRPGLVFNTAFVWRTNNKLYFFKDKDYWKFDKDNNLEKDYPQQITSRWGNLPENIDAVFTNPKDNKTYFFDGGLYYEYDEANLKIKDGYPKFIKDYWKGIPENNIDAVFVDKYDQVFFIKDKFMYEWDQDNEQSIATKTISDFWDSAPTNISSMFAFNNKVYITQSNKVYVYDSDTKDLESDSPKNINKVFKGI